MAFVKNKFIRAYSINNSSSSVQIARIIINKVDIEKITNFSSLSASEPILENNLNWNPSLGDTLDEIIDNSITISSQNRFIRSNNNCKVVLVDHGLNPVSFTKIDPKEPIGKSYFEKNDFFTYYVKFFVLKSPNDYDTILIYPNFNIITNVDNSKIRSISQTNKNKLAKKSIYNIVVDGIKNIIQKTVDTKFKEVTNVAVVKLLPTQQDGDNTVPSNDTSIIRPVSSDNIPIVISKHNNLDGPRGDSISAVPQIPPDDSVTPDISFVPIGGGVIPIKDIIAPIPPVILTNSGTTNNNRLTLTGISEPNSTVFVYGNSLELGSVLVGPDGVWTIVTEPLPNGEYVIFTVSVDASGNISDRSDTSTITIDTTITTDGDTTALFPPNTIGPVSPPNTTGPVSPPNTTGPVSPPNTTGPVSPPNTTDGEVCNSLVTKPE